MMSSPSPVRMFRPRPVVNVAIVHHGDQITAPMTSCDGRRFEYLVPRDDADFRPVARHVERSFGPSERETFEGVPSMESIRLPSLRRMCYTVTLRPPIF